MTENTVRVKKRRIQCFRILGMKDLDIGSLLR